MNDLEARYAKANIEFLEIIKWANEEDDKVIARLEKEGKLRGLDGHVEEFAPIRKEYCQRILALFDKYDLPNKPNFDRWLKDD